ncbi:hypothetical protein BJV77DRAFT_965233 [Russula vinacea]|nr:hypothetical protein BJV77DRAFT_965233 [Russula vinacea]
MVVANTISALSDIHTSATSPPFTSSSDPGIFTATSTILNKLLVALNECSKWGRVAILSALARYQAQDEKGNDHICERVVPQSQHVNGSVILAAVRVIMIHMRNVPREDFNKQLIRKTALLAFLLQKCNWAPEVDVDFVRRHIKAIGQSAVKIEAGAERCVNSRTRSRNA